VKIPSPFWTNFPVATGAALGYHPAMRPPPVLSLRGITKVFPGVRANDGVDLEIHRGEVHALVGENGAGKSTLMKILYGFYRADAGEIRFDGHPTEIRAPEDARRLGIGMVFQDFVQIPALSVAENLALFVPDLPFILDRGEIVRRIETTSRRYGLDVDPSAPVWRLSIGERQKVEVLKLLLADAHVLILDEPTRSLAPHEIEALFRTFDGLRRDGFAVVFITHKLQDVLACADRITVMRRGRVAGTLPRAGATESNLVSMMFGDGLAEAKPPLPRGRPPGAGPLLELRSVSTRAEGEAMVLDRVDLTIAPGEIVGVAGVSGNGQRELGDVILGLEPCTRGAKYLWGLDATGWSVARIRGSGVAFIPEDAREMAAVPGMTVLENMALGDTRRYARAGGLAIDWQAVREDLEGALGRLRVTLPSLDMPAGGLSGGNVQRMILARELAHGPRLIVAFYPTRGLDVRSAVAARAELVAARDVGAGVLLISEDLDELFPLSDRLVVLFRGRIVATATPQTITTEAIGYLMTGTRAP
jgi:general nucleoside transport system ATP-binding protein